MSEITIFSAAFDGPDVAGPARTIAARDARSAAWMAAAWASVTGRVGRVAAEAADDAALARLVADRSRVPVRIDAAEMIGAVDDVEAFCIEGSDVARAPVGEWARIDARPIRLERLAADLIGVLPAGAIICVESPRLEPVALAAAAAHPSVLALSRLCGASRGAAIAWAIGAKAASPQRTVVALTDATGFAIGGMDIATASRHDLPVAVVVANAERDLPAFELVAPMAGGHGEQVTEPSRLAIHLRNAMSVTIPTVINVAVEAAADRSLARR
ncbi:MAG TPA: thiamine pyrophosphate-dependent enzyme [Actinomycetota bacterium]